HGIVAMNGGSGSNTVTTHGAVNGGTGYGIVAANGVHSSSLAIINAGTIALTGPAGTTLSVTANDAVSGGTDGIHAWNNGTATTDVTAPGPARGTDRPGSVACSAATACDLGETAADASGAIYGIGAANGSTTALPGDTVVIASGTVSGGLAGIRAVNGG